MVYGSLGGSELDYADGVFGEGNGELVLDGAVVLGVGYYSFSVAHAVTVAAESSERAWTASGNSLGLVKTACSDTSPRPTISASL